MSQIAGNTELLVSTALQNNEVKNLFEEVKSRGSVSFKPSCDEFWSSATVGRTTVITVASTSNPSAALAHELLHAQLKLSGYKQYLTVVSNDLQKRTLGSILSMLDNELQHHKIFERFLEMGFSPQDFYADSDEDTYAEVSRSLEELTEHSSSCFFLNCFITIIAPGGVGSEEQRLAVRDQLERRCSVETWVKMLKVEQATNDWKECDHLDVSSTVVAVLRILGEFDNSWIGSECLFPGAGKFVRHEFVPK